MMYILWHMMECCVMCDRVECVCVICDRVE